jgi:hypothetical protein
VSETGLGAESARDIDVVFLGQMHESDIRVSTGLGTSGLTLHPARGQMPMSMSHVPEGYRAPFSVHDVVQVVVMPRWHCLQTATHWS